MKYMITGSTGADIRSFFPILKLDVYNNLTQATQAAISLINHDLTKFGDDFHLKTGNLSWEILDSNNNSWECIQIKEVNDYEKKNTKKFNQLYNHEVTLIEQQYSDRRDVNNGIAELNFYLDKTTKLNKKIRILQNAIKFDSKNSKRRQICNH